MDHPFLSRSLHLLCFHVIINENHAYGKPNKIGENFLLLKFKEKLNFDNKSDRIHTMKDGNLLSRKSHHQSGSNI